MGRRRQLRKRVNSEISLNSGAVSSDSESELSVVCGPNQTETGRKMSPNGNVDTDHSALAQANGLSESLACFGSQTLRRQENDVTIQTDDAGSRCDQIISHHSFACEGGASAPSDADLQSVNTSTQISNTGQSSRGQTVNANISRGLSMPQETQCRENGQRAQSDTGLQFFDAFTVNFDNDHGAQALPAVPSGSNRHLMGQTDTHRVNTQYGQSDTILPSFTLPGQTSGIDKAVQGNSVNALRIHTSEQFGVHQSNTHQAQTVTCLQSAGHFGTGQAAPDFHAHMTGRREHFGLQTKSHGGNTRPTQANTSLQSDFVPVENFDTDRTSQANLYRNTQGPEYSRPLGNARSETATRYAQADMGLRYTATTVPHSRTETIRSGSGDYSALERPGESIRNTLTDFCTQIKQQNEAQHKTLNECLMGTTTVLKECLAEVSNVVRESSISVNECVKGMAGQLSNLAEQNSLQFSRLHEMVASIRNDAYRPPSVLRDVIRVPTNETRSSAVTSHTPCDMHSQSTVAQNSHRETDQIGSLAGNSFLTRLSSSAPAEFTASSAHNITGHNQSHSGTYTYVSFAQTPSSRTCLGQTVHSENPMFSNIPGNLPGGIFTTQVCAQEPSTMSTTLDGHSVPRSSHFVTQNINNAANTNSSREIRNRGVKLPAFTGTSSDSWKVWFARFMTVADLYNWDEPTRLSELVQRLQGTAAEFVFDEIPPEIIGNFSSLVHELGLRFQTVETNKTFRVQFSKRVQRVGESVEDFSAELKRLYDKAYPGRNPEMRRQLLLQQFLGGLRDKQARFAVEYFKESSSLEDALHNVITYMEAQQGLGYKSDQSDGRRSKTVRFYGNAHGNDYDGDDSSDSDDRENSAVTPRSESPSNARRDRQTVRKIKTSTANTTSKSDSCPITDSLSQKEIDFIHRLVSSTEQELNVTTTSKTPGTLQGHPHFKQGQIRPQPQGQGQSSRPNRFVNIQCFHCLNFGHFKRDCAILKAEQGSNNNREPQRREPQPMQRPPTGQGYPTNIALN